MGECKLDHSVEDVQKKLADQSAFMPEELVAGVAKLLSSSPPQTVLNELFHLLKKYDLASEEEQSLRNGKLQELLS